MMGKPDLGDRLVQLLLALTALIALANGGYMIWDSYAWYQAVPGVKFTGPPNQHFIKDIGLAYLTVAIMLGYAARYPQGRWLAAVAGTMWLLFHGLLHVYEVVTGACEPAVFWGDAPGTLGPPLLGIIALTILFARQRITPAGAPKAAVLATIDRISPDESAYFHEVAAAPGNAFEKLANFMPVTMHRHEAPADLFHMARIGATLVEDCGPCALTAAQGALGDGVDRDLVNAALRAEPPEGDLKSAFVFGAAIARQAGEAFTLGDEIERQYGRTVRLELAMTAATVRAYPAMKRGLGLSKSCSITPLQV